MRNLGRAILAGGLLVGTAGVATAQNLASAVPAPKNDIVVFADRGSTLSSTATALVRSVANEASGKVTLIGRPENIAAVKGELLRNGVAAQDIVAQREARAPIAKPADGLSDPIDRRVEIRF